MLTTVLAEVHGGKVKLLEQVDLPDGTRVLVTVLPKEGEDDFWLKTSQDVLAKIWASPQDEVYAELLKK